MNKLEVKVIIAIIVFIYFYMLWEKNRVKSGYASYGERAPRYVPDRSWDNDPVPVRDRVEEYVPPRYERRPAPNGTSVGDWILNAAVTDGFDFPVGKPDGTGYYIAQGFLQSGHSGEDWNGISAGNSDLGDPVYAVANGVVYESRNNGGNWGNVVRIAHNIGTQDRPILLESLYAHLDTMYVRKGDQVKRGDNIGTIGTANGRHNAHLHLELRDQLYQELGSTGYANSEYNLAPTAFITDHRPRWFN